MTAKLYVFSLPTCAPCKLLKEDLTKNEEWLKSKGIEVEHLDMSETSDHTLELATKYGIRSAPTMILAQYGVGIPLKTVDELKRTYTL